MPARASQVKIPTNRPHRKKHHFEDTHDLKHHLNIIITNNQPIKIEIQKEKKTGQIINWSYKSLFCYFEFAYLPIQHTTTYTHIRITTIQSTYIDKVDKNSYYKTK